MKQWNMNLQLEILTGIIDVVIKCNKKSSEASPGGPVKTISTIS